MKTLVTKLAVIALVVSGFTWNAAANGDPYTVDFIHFDCSPERVEKHMAYLSFEEFCYKVEVLCKFVGGGIDFDLVSDGGVGFGGGAGTAEAGCGWGAGHLLNSMSTHTCFFEGGNKLQVKILKQDEFECYED